MAEAVNAMPIDRGDFRDVVRNPEAHAAVLGQYRIGEYAGVVLIPRILNEMAPDDRLRRAMEIHLRDEARHTQVFTDWITRLGLAPQPFPTEIESFFAASPEELRRAAQGARAAAGRHPPHPDVRRHQRDRAAGLRPVRALTCWRSTAARIAKRSPASSPRRSSI